MRGFQRRKTRVELIPHLHFSLTQCPLLCLVLWVSSPILNLDISSSRFTPSHTCHTGGCTQICHACSALQKQSSKGLSIAQTLSKKWSRKFTGAAHPMALLLSNTKSCTGVQQCFRDVWGWRYRCILAFWVKCHCLSPAAVVPTVVDSCHCCRVLKPGELTSWFHSVHQTLGTPRCCCW